MTPSTHRLMVGLALVVMVASGCGGGGQIEIQNMGAGAVSVQSSGDDSETIEANGGMVAYTDECYEGPLVMTFEGGRVVELSESLCPGQRLLINDQDAKIDAGVSG